jgi:hypothetical protein
VYRFKFAGMCFGVPRKVLRLRVAGSLQAESQVMAKAGHPRQSLMLA